MSQPSKKNINHPPYAHAKHTNDKPCGCWTGKTDVQVVVCPFCDACYESAEMMSFLCWICYDCGNRYVIEEDLWQ